MADAQEIVDRFYVQHGPCCAGCDWWHRFNSMAGECHRGAPVSGHERIGMLGISYSSLPLAAGHTLTTREHHCGEFKDGFDWSALPAHYLRRIGWTTRTAPQASEVNDGAASLNSGAAMDD